MVGADDDAPSVWDLETGGRKTVLNGHQGAAVAIALSRDGRLALSASVDTTITVSNLENGQAIGRLRGHNAPVQGIAVTPDGRRALSVAFDNERQHVLIVWDVERSQALHTLQGQLGVTGSGRPFALALSDDGCRAYFGSLKVWEFETAAEPRSLLNLHPAVALAVTPDGRLAVSALDDPQNRTLTVWDVERGARLCSLPGHTMAISALALTPDGGLALSGSIESHA